MGLPGRQLGSWTRVRLRSVTAVLLKYMSEIRPQTSTEIFERQERFSRRSIWSWAFFLALQPNWTWSLQVKSHFGT